MHKSLQGVIDGSTFSVQGGNYAYVQVKSAPVIDKHFLVSKDKDEVTIVTAEENVTEFDVIEENKEHYY